MNTVCRHCDELIEGKAYRVISEEHGVVLLDMVVCGSCAAAAASLQLHTEEITSKYGNMPASVSDTVPDLLVQNIA